MSIRSAQAILRALGTPAPDDATLTSRALLAVAALGVGFGSVHGVAAVLLGEGAVAALAGLHLTLGVLALIGRSLVRSGRSDHSIDAVVAGILVTSVAWTVVMPGLESVSALGPLLAIAYALPRRGGRSLTGIVLASMATSVAIVLIDSLAPPGPESAYIAALHAPTLAGGTILIALALWQFGVRMRAVARAASETSDLLRIRDRAIAAAPSGIIILDVRVPGWRIASVNPAFERITGYTAEEVIGTSGLQLTGPDTDPETLARHRATIEAGESGTVTILNYRADGSTYWNELSVAPIDEGGSISHYVVIQTDVTAAVTLDEQLRQAQRMETVGQLAGGVAHDFNNILTAIGGYARMAEDELRAIASREAPDPAAAATGIAGHVTEIRLATDRAAALTRQLLAFGRREVVEPEVVAVETVVTRLLPMLRRLTGEQHTIDAALAAGLPPVLIDPTQLEQVLINLVVNARDASPDGARIRIETARASAPPSGDAAMPVAGFVRLAVTDHGSGIAPAVQARMFEPFFTTKPRGHGTGLGLATVYGIVSAAGGTIHCTSSIGVGTTFTVDLPAVAEPVAGSSTGTPSSRVDVAAGCETVLLVEDEDAVRTLVATVLRRAGYCVLEAPDGAAGLALAEDAGDRIDILVSDVVMPRLNGPQLAARLLARRPLPVVLMSGYPDGALEPIVGRRPRLLQKPFEAEALLIAVREELDRARDGAAGSGPAVATGSVVALEPAGV